MSSRQIHVRFIDAATGNVFGETMLEPERLPQTFELATTLHIAEQEWSVVKTEPMTAAEFIQTGELALTLAKVTYMNPKDILYSLPTICDAIPAIAEGSTRLGKQVFALHEDDWRQVEFISQGYKNAIEREFAGIERIFQEASKETDSFRAFTELHVRSLIPQPLAGPLALDQLAALLPPERSAYEGIAYQRQEGLLEGGFAWQAGPLVLYGQQSDGFMTALGIQIASGAPALSPGFVTALAVFMDAHHLYLVDWCNTTLIPADAPDALRSASFRRFHARGSHFEAGDGAASTITNHPTRPARRA
jgi:hypothetical protein